MEFGRRVFTDLAWNMATLQEQWGIVGQDGGKPVTDESRREGPLLEKQYTKHHSQPRSLLPLVQQEGGANKGPRLRWPDVKSAVPAGERGGNGKYRRCGESRTCLLDSPNKKTPGRKSKEEQRSFLQREKKQPLTCFFTQQQKLCHDTLLSVHSVIDPHFSLRWPKILTEWRTDHQRLIWSGFVEMNWFWWSDLIWPSWLHVRTSSTEATGTDTGAPLTLTISCNKLIKYIRKTIYQ